MYEDDMFILVNFVACLKFAKAEEERARKKRIQAEEAIVELIPGPEKGQRTVTLPDGKKVVVTRGLNYKADVHAIGETSKKIAFRAPVKFKTNAELDVENYEWLKKNHPNEFAQFAQHVEVKPKKTAVTIKE